MVEKASDARWNRLELQRLMDQLRSGDVVVVWKLDRLSRSLKDLLILMERIDKARVFRTASTIGNAQMQFNYIDNETLKQAQEKSEEYRHLMMRVAGYSAFFVELSNEVQDEIISRTELCFLLRCSGERLLTYPSIIKKDVKTLCRSYLSVG